MKTIYINGRFLTQRITGVQRYAREIVKAIDAKNSEWGDLRFVLLVPSNYDKSYMLNNIPIQIIDGSGNYYWEQIKVPFFLKKKKDYYLLSLCNVSPLVLKDKNIVTVHDLAVIDHPEFYSKKFVCAYRFIFKHQLKNSKLVITVSEFSKKEILDYYKLPSDKVIVAYNAVNDNFGNDGVSIDDLLDNPNNKPICFSVGSASANKNMKYVIECAKKNPDYLFVVSGAKNKVFSAVSQSDNDLPENVKAVGYLNDDQLRCVYKKCDFFLFPSIYEGFGIPPLEAVSFGCKKIIVSDIPTMREIFGEKANYINPLDYQNVALLKNAKSYDYVDIKPRFKWGESVAIILCQISKLC